MWVDAYYWEETHIKDFENNRKATSKIKEKDINVLKNCTKIVLVVEVTNHYA